MMPKCKFLCFTVFIYDSAAYVAKRIAQCQSWPVFVLPYFFIQASFLAARLQMLKWHQAEALILLS